MNPKLIRITTVPGSLRGLLKGQLSFMNNHYEVIAISSSGVAWSELKKNEIVRSYQVEMTRVISIWKDLKSVWLLYKIFRKEKPLIVHTHTPKAGTVGMLAAWLAGVPIRLHTVAGMPLLEAKGMKRNVLDIVEWATYKCATRVYPNSFEMMKIIINNNLCKVNKLKVIANGSSNGINTSHFNPSLVSEEQKCELRESLKIKPDDFIFVFVGRLVKDKGINELVASFTQLQQRHTKIKLLLVGGYEETLDPLSKETMSEIRSNANIIEAGFQQDVRPFFAISDVLTFPSYREGFPNVVMQAGAMSLPSIVTDINGCNEIITNGVNGLVVPPKDVNALKDAMELLLEDDMLRKKIKSNAREMITSRYEQQIVWEALLKEYKDLEAKYV